jgi:hypothetical protein
MSSSASSTSNSNVESRRERIINESKTLPLLGSVNTEECVFLLKDANVSYRWEQDFPAPCFARFFEPEARRVHLYLNVREVCRSIKAGSLSVRCAQVLRSLNPGAFAPTLVYRADMLNRALEYCPAITRINESMKNGKLEPRVLKPHEVAEWQARTTRAGIKSTLFEHQLAFVAHACALEAAPPVFEFSGSPYTPQLLRLSPREYDACGDDDESEIFIEPSGRICLRSDGVKMPVRTQVPARAFALADRAGTGKTLAMIALAQLDPNPAPVLVLCPPQVAAQWKDELNDHLTNAGNVHSITSLNDFKKLRAKDLEPDAAGRRAYVITTHAFLTHPHWRELYACPEVHGVHTRVDNFETINKRRRLAANETLVSFGNVKWRRVILDEAHLLMPNTHSGAKHCMAAMTVTLRTDFRWIVSASIAEDEATYTCLRSLMVPSAPDMRIDSSTGLACTRSIPYTNTENEDAVHRLIVRSARAAGCTSNIIETVTWLVMSNAERFMYETHENEISAMRTCILPRLLDTDGNVVGSLEDARTKCVEDCTQKIANLETEIVNLRAIILILADPLERTRFERTLNTNIAMKTRMQGVLAFMRSAQMCEDCPICFEKTPSDELDAAVLPCLHLLCKPCFTRASSNGTSCPICRTSWQEGSRSTRPMFVLGKARDARDDLAAHVGTKMAETIRLLLRLRDSGEKAVLFSSHDSALREIAAILVQHGFLKRVYSVRGNTNSRAKAIREFRRSVEPSVLLLSTENCATGVSLVEARHVIMIDVIRGVHAKDMEMQAVSRVFRIGQTRDVFIHRLLMKNTIEETIFTEAYGGGFDYRQAR